MGQSMQRAVRVAGCDLGKAAAKLVVERIEAAQAEPRIERLAVEFVPRMSTAAPASR